MTHAWKPWQGEAPCCRLHRRVQDGEGPAGFLPPMLCQLAQRVAAVDQVHALRCAASQPPALREAAQCSKADQVTGVPQLADGILRLCRIDSLDISVLRELC